MCFYRGCGPGVYVHKQYILAPWPPLSWMDGWIQFQNSTWPDKDLFLQRSAGGSPHPVVICKFLSLFVTF